MKNSKMKKSLSLILSLIMILSALPLTALSSFAATSGDWEYSVSNNKATITKYKGTATEVTIPFEIDGYSVTKIGAEAFKRTSLTSITIPNSVTSIGDQAFRDCSSLTSVTIPDSVTSIGDYAFYGCTSFTSITIPNSVSSIGGSAFYGCTSLTSITIPNSVSSIGGGVFHCCTSLTGINVDSNNQKYCSVNGVLFNKDKSILIQYPAGKTDKEYIIPDSVLNIEHYAFMGCSSLKSIIIPNSFTSIVDFAFYGCTSLTSITIPNSVTSISSCAFYWCTSLSEVTIPNSVTSISSSAFKGCTSLASITIPNNVTSIGEYAFESCTSLASITIPNNVTSIGKYAFESCTSLKSINVDSNNPSYCSYNGVLFNKDKSELIQYPAGKTDKQYSIPNSVTSIGDQAFRDCSSLTSVTIPDSVTSIGDYAFSWCTSLASVTIGNSVTSISSSAFKGCTSLTIYGYTNSYAEKYAKEHKIPFKVIGTEEPQSDVIHNGFKTYKKEDNYQGENGYYFKNSYFDQSATKYNQSLATMSLCLAFSTYGYGDYDKYDKNVKTILNQCGFKMYEQYHFNEKPTANSIGCAIACKELPNGTPLIAVAVRSSGYESEWASNLDVGLTGDHYGFNDAAGKVVDYIKDYIACHPQITGEVKIWITGFSRAAATATQAAAKLNKTKISNVSISKDSIYAYGFATPSGAISTNNPNSSDYDNIFNIIHYDDIVPLVAPANWGFGRYGKTLVFLDKTNCKNYSEYAPKMYKQFNKIDKNYELDNFSSAINTLTGKEPLGVFNRELINSVAWSLSNYDSINARLIYRTNYQEPIKLLLDGAYGGDDHEKLGFGGIELLANPNTYSSLFNLLNLNTYATATAAYNAKYLAMAHANPSYYLAWMQSMDVNYYPNAKYKFSNGDYRYALFNCKVDINVYDNETNKLVASIINEKPVEIEGSSIVAIIDNNGQKVIYLPVDGDYRIETVSRDNTEVTASIIEKYGVSGIDSRVCNFSDISTNKKDHLEMKAPSYSEDELINGTENGSDVNYELSLNGNDVEPTIDITGTEQINEHQYAISTDYNKNEGIVYGEGQYIEDTFVMLTAEPKSCFEFEGFYIDGKKITDDDLDNNKNTVRIEVKKDTKVVAKFIYKGFPDVKEGDWYYDVVKYVAKKGYIRGYQNGNFGPNDSLKRQDFVCILARIDGADLKAYENVQSKLTDVKKGDYYAAAVNWAVDKGYISGYKNGKFGVNDPITREQVATILYNYMDKPEVENAEKILTKFPDANKVSDFAKTPVAWAVSNGVISGMGNGTVASTSGATRAQIAAIIQRMDKQGMFNN